MKILRRLSLMFCAIGVFINVALGGILLSSTTTSLPLGPNSKQVAFQKVAKDFNVNAAEYEEDVELDGDEDLHFSMPAFMASETFELNFHSLSLQNVALQNTYNIDYRSIRKVPFFITYENFRI